MCLCNISNLSNLSLSLSLSIYLFLSLSLSHTHTPSLTHTMKHILTSTCFFITVRIIHIQNIWTEFPGSYEQHVLLLTVIFLRYDSENIINNDGYRVVCFRRTKRITKSQCTHALLTNSTAR